MKELRWSRCCINKLLSHSLPRKTTCHITVRQTYDYINITQHMSIGTQPNMKQMNGLMKVPQTIDSSTSSKANENGQENSYISMSDEALGKEA